MAPLLVLLVCSVAGRAARSGIHPFVCPMQHDLRSACGNEQPRSTTSNQWYQCTKCMKLYQWHVPQCETLTIKWQPKQTDRSLGCSCLCHMPREFYEDTATKQAPVSVSPHLGTGTLVKDKNEAQATHSSRGLLFMQGCILQNLC